MGRLFVDHIGEQYGNLIVRRYAGVDEQSSNARLWECRCSCGNETTVRWAKLHSGHTQSCGCLRAKNGGKKPLPLGLAAFNRHYFKYSLNAKKRGFTFELTREEFRFLTQAQCYYCGKAPTIRADGYAANGIDRIDNRKGYILGNVCSCCSQCNRAKGTINQEQFIAVALRIAQHHRPPK